MKAMLTAFLAIAVIAVGAAKPLMADRHPAMKPRAGW